VGEHLSIHSQIGIFRGQKQNAQVFSEQDCWIQERKSEKGFLNIIISPRQAEEDRVLEDTKFVLQVSNLAFMVAATWILLRASLAKSEKDIQSLARMGTAFPYQVAKGIFVDKVNAKIGFIYVLLSALCQAIYISLPTKVIELLAIDESVFKHLSFKWVPLLIIEVATFILIAFFWSKYRISKFTFQDENSI
jgi:hypothetical protein